jgi:hypothetical protein
VSGAEPALDLKGEAAALDAALIRLHGGDDAAALSTLHERAAALLAADPRARRFHLTHAWVHALEAGDARTVARLEAALVAAGGLDRAEA